MAWNDERVELLKKLWAEGLSASQIASRMGGVTRNAVIGKVHRLGLSGRATPAKPQRGCRHHEGDVEDARLLGEEPPMKPIIPEPEFAAPVVLEGGDLATVATLKGNMCKWPIGDPTSDDFHFCGQPTPAGKSYCPYHAHLAFQPSAQRRPERRPEPARLAPSEAHRRRAAG
ncbi:GcrA family cell cycle regulator [Amphiplicatus metriothermophilus]|uniref:GcrA cell cycle regulator n=1 Tax=Amphiplicatus metriothermophilus TaxID=1519374 RepID=A0A239PKR7_9PROT|nr:GcrA family cell cycle regulator [Amphiplicatus metriothermophilus]MBB5517767.1 GcrA cell cycle regulator [Amphiplicatus metriothermophilus]SNT67899.1 GcrA cell cycle regulator [Amphiplicatus metriothermophilus]